MNYRQLGDSELKVSEIGLGSWLTYGVGVEQKEADACVRRSFDEGIKNFFGDLFLLGLLSIVLVAWRRFGVRP